MTLPSSPLDVTFDIIDGVLRMAHKYEADQHQTWTVAQLTEYPNAEESPAIVYAHRKWSETQSSASAL